MAARIIKINVDSQSYVRNYITVMNCCFNLSDRELAVLEAMINNAEQLNGTLICYSKNIKDVRSEIDVTNGYISSMMARIREKGVIEYDREQRGWIVNDMMNPYAKSDAVEGLTFQFHFDNNEEHIGAV